MSRRPRIVVVAGLPAAGKTTLASAVAERARVPLIAKDSIKERLFDTLGTGDRDWSRRLGAATYGVMFDVLRSLVSVGQRVVVEGTFNAELADREFQALNENSPFEALQLFCVAPADLLMARATLRLPARHAGHGGREALAALPTELEAGTWRELDLPGDRLEVDTSGASIEDFVALGARFLDTGS